MLSAYVATIPIIPTVELKCLNRTDNYKGCFYFCISGPGFMFAYGNNFLTSKHTRLMKHTIFECTPWSLECSFHNMTEVLLNCVCIQLCSLSFTSYFLLKYYYYYYYVINMEGCACHGVLVKDRRQLKYLAHSFQFYMCFRIVFTQSRLCLKCFILTKLFSQPLLISTNNSKVAKEKRCSFTIQISFS